MALGERLRRGLRRTRDVLNTPVEDVFRGRVALAREDLDGIEEALLEADMGLPLVERCLELLRERSFSLDGGAPAMRALLREEVARSLRAEPPARFGSRPWVVLAVGVNGAGKTTTLGKLASAWKGEGRKVMLCAADTFRAAAVEQLEIWARRLDVPLQRGAEGSDPAAVVTDALRAAAARGHDALLVDTAGRLHTRGNLMAELAKVVKVAGREVDGAPHETLLVLDATVGSNGLQQAREFAKAAPVTGLVLTKLDGSARGGAAVAITQELGLPIRYVGVGESAEDLLPFDADAFAEGLFGD